MRIHSWVSDRCEVRRSSIAGNGLHAREPFCTGEIVAVMGGKIYSTAELAHLAKSYPHVHANAFAVAPGLSLGSPDLFELDDSELINHSCNANCGVIGQIIIVARRHILPHEELTLDYDTFELHPSPFDCRCGAACCRGTVLTGRAWEDADFVRKNAAYLSWYVAERIRQQTPHHA